MACASRYNHESESTTGDLEEAVAMPITEASVQPDFLALRFEAPARIDRNSPLQGDGFNRNSRTHGIEALGRLELVVDAQRHDSYLCEARLRHFGARRQRVQKMQSSYSFRVGSGLSTEEDT